MEKLAVILLFSSSIGIILIYLNFLLNKKKVAEYVANHCQKHTVKISKYVVSLSPYHPNNICYLRTMLAWLSIGIYGYKISWHIIGIILYISAAFMDALDGIVARKCQLITRWGETLDPICDKLSYLAPIWYFSWIGYIPLELFYIFTFLEIPGQMFARWILSHLGQSVAANNFGKVKAALCFCLVPYCFVLDHNGVYLPNFTPQIMQACIVLSFLSFAFKLIPNRYYANILSGLNLVCGVVACFFCFKRGFFSQYFVSNDWSTI